MNWTNDLSVKFVKLYGKHPVLWDSTHKWYKIQPKKDEAWEEISDELNVDVPVLKRKMTSLLATYRKVRQRQARSGFDDIEPVWFAFKAFGFLHNRYKPKTMNNTEESLTHWSESDNEDTETFKTEEDGACDATLFSEEPNDDDELENHLSTAPQKMTRKRKRILLSRKSNLPYKYSASHHPRRAGVFTALYNAVNRKRDEFDAYGEYVANILRTMDKTTRSYVKKEFGEIIFQAESGAYASQMETLPPF